MISNELQSLYEELEEVQFCLDSELQKLQDNNFENEYSHEDSLLKKLESEQSIVKLEQDKLELLDKIKELEEDI